MTQNEKQWECMKWNEEGITWEFTLKKKGNDVKDNVELKYA